MLLILLLDSGCTILTVAVVKKLLMSLFFLGDMIGDRSDRWHPSPTEAFSLFFHTAISSFTVQVQHMMDACSSQLIRKRGYLTDLRSVHHAVHFVSANRNSGFCGYGYHCSDLPSSEFRPSLSQSQPMKQRIRVANSP